MFIHLLAGMSIFWIGGYSFNLEITKSWLVLGAFWGIFPDFLSLSMGIRLDKWCHEHRDNISHSIFLPLIFILCSLGSPNVLLAGCAILSHSFLDSFGIGWGVKVFYPISHTTYKLFYKGKFLTRFSPQEIREEAEKYGMDDWIRRVYLNFSPVHLSRFWGLVEWISLFICIILLLLY